SLPVVVHADNKVSRSLLLRACQSHLPIDSFSTPTYPNPILTHALQGLHPPTHQDQRILPRSQPNNPRRVRSRIRMSPPYPLPLPFSTPFPDRSAAPQPPPPHPPNPPRGRRNLRNASHTAFPTALPLAA